MNKTFWILGVIIIALALIWFLRAGDTPEDQLSSMEDTSTSVQEANVGESVVDNPEQAVVQKQEGSYESFSSEKLSLAEEGKVLLFFHAPWCPICRALESEITADLSAIPDGVHILKVDFDSATQLRQKYGVTVQHTFVQVDAGGNLIQRWSDSSKLSQALGKIK